MWKATSHLCNLFSLKSVKYLHLSKLLKHRKHASILYWVSFGGCMCSYSNYRLFTFNIKWKGMGHGCFPQTVALAWVLAFLTPWFVKPVKMPLLPTNKVQVSQCLWRRRFMTNPSAASVRAQALCTLLTLISRVRH